MRKLVRDLSGNKIGKRLGPIKSTTEDIKTG